MKERISNLGDWAELKARVAGIYEKTLYPRKIWEELREKPLKKESIDELIKDGWKVCLVKSVPGLCLKREKEIWISRELDGFERDITLFHELVHAWYGDELSDSSLARWRYENNLITEWLARNLRAQPDLLRHAIVAFGFKPAIYDKSSYLAFNLNPEALGNFESGLQPILPPFEPFVKEYFAKINKIRME